MGLHGDHIGGERDAARALMTGEVDAACMIDANHLAFSQGGDAGGRRHPGHLPDRAVRPLQHDRRRLRLAALVDRFGELLLAMDYADAEVRPLLDLEGLTAWLPGRVEGYQALDRAVDQARFYDDEGRIHAADYRP